MSRSSAKIRDHVEITSIPRADPRLRHAKRVFCFRLLFSGMVFRNGFPEFASGSSLPAPGSYQSGCLPPR
jgi:hypothetical protein